MVQETFQKQQLLQQVCEYWVKPACSFLPVGLNTPARWQIVTGIGNVESGYQAIVQYGGGPALSFWQIEPSCFHDLFKNFLMYRPDLLNSVTLCLDGQEPTPQRMVWDCRFAALICALIVYRSPLALPAYNDTPAQVNYWLSDYNTPMGAGTSERATPLFEEVQNIVPITQLQSA